MAAHAVAFGDSFAIALAQAEQARVIPGDGEIRRCGLVLVDSVGVWPVMRPSAFPPQQERAPETEKVEQSSHVEQVMALLRNLAH
jgi:hypothetical protein